MTGDAATLNGPPARRSISSSIAAASSSAWTTWNAIASDSGASRATLGLTIEDGTIEPRK
jgi:hypothetical protein